MPIVGLHALMYAKKDDETRRFLRDVLGFKAVDAGRGWLIFGMPPAELAVPAGIFLSALKCVFLDLEAKRTYL